MSSLLVFKRIYSLEIQPVMFVFSAPLVNYSPSNLLTGSPPPPPLPVWIRIGLCIYSVCNWGGRGEGSGCVEIIYRSNTLYIWPHSEPRNTCRQVPLQILRKADI